MKSHSSDTAQTSTTTTGTDGRLEPRTLQTRRLWQAYKRTGDLELRNRLVLQYTPLVRYVAGRVRSGLPDTVDPADLVSEGVIGMMDAIDKFEPERGLQFQTYAVPRIRGAIVDSLRSADWVPRSVRSRHREVEHARAEAERRLGRSPDEDELAAELGTTVEELRSILARTAHARVSSLDELGDTEQPESSAWAQALEDAETRQALLTAIAGLPERDRIIVALYYYEGITLAEIGQVLHVSESRVSQLHSRLTAALRDRLEDAA